MVIDSIVCIEKAKFQNLELNQKKSAIEYYEIQKFSSRK